MSCCCMAAKGGPVSRVTRLSSSRPGMWPTRRTAIIEVGRALLFVVPLWAGVLFVSIGLILLLHGGRL